MTKPLEGMQVVNLGINVPGPVTAARLVEFGASVTKVVPPDGDPLALGAPEWYAELTRGQRVLTLNLKDPADLDQLHEYLAQADLLLTTQRPAALARLGLAWDALHARHPKLCQVAVVGYPPPDENRPGHDLTYMAEMGLVAPPELPLTLVADLAGCERAACAALALVLARERGAGAGYAEAPLAEAADAFAEPLRQGLTAPGGVLGGGIPSYGIYRTSDGYVAVAALEAHLFARLLDSLGTAGASRDELAAIFVERTSEAWAAWGREHDLPVAAVKSGAATRMNRVPWRVL